MRSGATGESCEGSERSELHMQGVKIRDYGSPVRDYGSPSYDLLLSLRQLARTSFP